MQEPWMDTIRRAAKDSGISTYQLSQQAGITVSRLQDFLENGTGMSAGNLERLGRFLGFELRQRSARKRSREASQADGRTASTGLDG